MSGITIDVDSLGGIKMLRESLRIAQLTISQKETDKGLNIEHSSRIQELIEQLDTYRPLNANGKHGDRHTLFCGCDEVKKILERTPFQG